MASRYGMMGKALGQMNGRAAPMFRGLGAIGRRDKNVAESVLLRSGRRRAMGLGAGAIVLNARRTGNSTGGMGRVNPRSSGGFA